MLIAADSSVTIAGHGRLRADENDARRAEILSAFSEVGQSGLTQSFKAA
jgi:hypothetical protein